MYEYFYNPIFQLIIISDQRASESDSLTDALEAGPETVGAGWAVGGHAGLQGVIIVKVETGLAVQTTRVVLAHAVRHGRPTGRERPELAARRVPEAEAPARTRLAQCELVIQ